MAPPIKPLLGLARLGSTALGAGVGAATAEEDESRLLRGLGGALLGGVVAPGAVGAAARGYRRGGGGATGAADALTEWTYFNFLGSPDTMIRASAGGVGGALIGALEDATEGVLRNDPEMIARSGKILKGLVGRGKDEGYKLWEKTLHQSPEEYTRSFRELDPELAALDPEQYLRGESLLGRFFSAADLVANKALQAGGRTPREAARYTLTGQANTKTAQGILDLQKQFREGTPAQRVLGTQVMPFARVALLSGEKALEHTPIVGHFMHKAYRANLEAPIRKRIAELLEEKKKADRVFGDAEKSRKVSRQLKKERAKLKAIADEQPSTLRKGIQQGLGAGSVLAGRETEKRLDPRVGAVFAPFAGPTYIPFRLGQQAVRSLSADPDASYIDIAAETAKELSPLGHRPMAIFDDFGAEAARRLVPSGAADIAEAIDPAFTRSTGPAEVREAVQRGQIESPTLGASPFGIAATGRLPFLREQLPEEFMPTDIFGNPRFDKAAVFGDPGARSERNDLLRAISRGVFPSRQTLMPPVLDLSDPNQAIFRELGLTPGAPSTRVNLPGLDVPLQHTAESAAAVARHRGLARQITGRLLSNMPALRNMPDSPQKQLLVRRIAEMVQRRISQALSAGTLPIALSQGAQLPGWLQRPL